MREYQLSRNWASQISEPLKVPDSLTKIIERKDLPANWKEG